MTNKVSWILIGPITINNNKIIFAIVQLKFLNEKKFSNTYSQTFKLRWRSNKSDKILKFLFSNWFHHIFVIYFKSLIFLATEILVLKVTCLLLKLKVLAIELIICSIHWNFCFSQSKTYQIQSKISVKQLLLKEALLVL